MPKDSFPPPFNVIKKLYGDDFIEISDKISGRKKKRLEETHPNYLTFKLRIWLQNVKDKKEGRTILAI